MNIQIPRRAASRHRAAMLIAREHLLAHPRCHRRRRALRRRRIERANDPGVAVGALDHLRRDVDLAARAVLRRAPAIRALLVRDLVRWARGAGPRRDHRTAQRLDELAIIELATA